MVQLAVPNLAASSLLSDANLTHLWKDAEFNKLLRGPDTIGLICSELRG